MHHLDLLSLMAMLHSSGVTIDTKVALVTVAGQKRFLAHPTGSFWAAVPFLFDRIVDQSNRKIHLKIMTTRILAGVALPVRLAYSDRDHGDNNNIQSMHYSIKYPAEYPQIEPCRLDGGRVVRAIAIIAINSTKVVYVVPLCAWSGEGLSLAFLLGVPAHG